MSSTTHFFKAADKITLSRVSLLNAEFFTNDSSPQIRLASKRWQVSHNGRPISRDSSMRCPVWICLNMSPEMALTVCLLPEPSTMSTIRVIIVLPSAPSLFRACKSSVSSPLIDIDLCFISFLLGQKLLSRSWVLENSHTRAITAPQFQLPFAGLIARVGPNPWSKPHGICGFAD